MANRTVSVGLELHAEQYKVEADVVKEKTREVKDEVRGTDQELNKIPPDAAKAAAAMRLLGAEGENASLRLRDLGGSSTALQEIESRLKVAQEETRRLAEEFNRTGNGSTLHALFGSQAAVKDLEELKTKVAKSLEQGGQEGGQSMFATIKGWLSTPVLGPVTAGALIAGAIVAAPIIGGLVGGAVTGALGSGGLFAGALLQIKENSAVQASAKDFGRWLMTELTSDTRSFATPLMDAFGILKTDLRGPMADLKSDFAALAPYERDFAQYLGAAVEKLMPGLNRLLQGSGPVLTEFGHGLVYVTDGLNVMFDEISKGGKGEVEALDFTFRLLGQTLAATGFFVRAMANTFDFLIQTEKTVVDWADKIFGSWTLLGPILHLTHLKDELDGVSRSFDDSGSHLGGFGRALTVAGGDAQLTADDMKHLSAQINATTVTADTLAAQMSKKVFDSLMSVDQATIGWHQAVLALHDTLAKNGLQIDKHTHSIDLNSKAGLANYSAILAVVQANMASYQAQIAVGVSAADATKAYDANTKALEKQLRQAGYNQAAIDGLIGKYRQVPDQVNTAIAIQGLTQAINDLVELQRYLAGLPSTKYIDIVTRQTMVNNINNNMGHPNRWGGIYTHAATGALRQADVFSPVAPARYAFAEPETMGEAFVPRVGDYNRSTAIIDQAARWYGGRFVAGGGWSGGSVINLTVNAGMGTDGYRVGRQIADALRPYVERSGGSVQQAVMRRS